ncbi:MAG TPA: NADH-quinone oxidoreductase subunit N [Terriglobia bacterium]|nr:NADH-quinone oxidoreductase subunit N [Terriglobia bacterium]
MNSADLTALLPLIVISATAIVVMLATAIRRNHAVSALVTLIGLAAAFVSLWRAAALVPRQASPLLVVDGYALFYTGLILAAAFVVVVLSYGYFERQKEHREELYILLLVAVLGAAVLVASGHFVSFLLGLELLSIALYALNAYLRERTLALEAGIKYLILAAASAAFLLFGMALIYAELGTMEFSRIATLISSGAEVSRPILLAGVALLFTGFGFKLALVPFHLWTPDIYEGAPAPVTAFVATVSKGAMFALLLRYFYTTAMARLYEPIFAILVILAVASMIAGNVLALMQNSVKRILAYSSIAHMGYVLVAFLASGSMGAQAVTFYLVAYFITTLGAFGVVTVLSPSERDADQLDDYRGLFWKRPVLGSIFTLMLLSLAGIPATAGFFAKFYIVAAGASAAIWGLIILLVLTSVVGLYYYLRVVVAVYSAPIEKSTVQLNPSLPLASSAILGVLGILLVWLGVAPSYLLGVVSTAVGSLTP